MPPIPKRVVNSFVRLNESRNILYLCHPTHEEWAMKMKKKSKDFGSDVTLLVQKNFSDLFKYLAEVRKKQYACIVVIPGHGCEPFYCKKVKKPKQGQPNFTMEPAQPGIVWSENALATGPQVQIKGKTLKKFVNACLKVTEHLHFSTCHQGCMLSEYDDMVCAYHSEPYTISGWKHGALMIDCDVDRFLFLGCHGQGRYVNTNKFAYWTQKNM